MNQWKILGMMSGTSLDGLDIALCSFQKGDNRHFKILKAETIAYSGEEKEFLNHLYQSSGSALIEGHHQFGKYLGRKAKEFFERHKLSADFIASHGHTIYHQPEKRFTFQAGSGAEIAVISGTPVVCDFRTTDIALGGQGAPLVPIGDELLFGQYAACLNLGGFSNISFNKNGKRLAFDISPVNIVLNYLSEKLGKPFDKDGLIAASAKIHTLLLKNLNDAEFYSAQGPKSLGVEWVKKEVFPLLESSGISIEDQIATYTEHTAEKISKTIKECPPGTVLVTGGGAYNDFLIKKIKEKSQRDIHLPEPELIEFKEALIFAFLGLLRWEHRTNCLSSVTGASRDSCSGAIYLP